MWHISGSTLEKSVTMGARVVSECEPHCLSEILHVAYHSQVHL